MPGFRAVFENLLSPFLFPASGREKPDVFKRVSLNCTFALKIPGQRSQLLMDRFEVSQLCCRAHPRISFHHGVNDGLNTRSVELHFGAGVGWRGWSPDNWHQIIQRATEYGKQRSQQCRFDLFGPLVDDPRQLRTADVVTDRSQAFL